METVVAVILVVAGVAASLGLIGLSLFASYRSFRHGNALAGTSFLALIAIWLASHLRLPMILFTVSYNETGGENPGLYAVLLMYSGIAATLCYLVIRFMRKLV